MATKNEVREKLIEGLEENNITGAEADEVAADLLDALSDVIEMEEDDEEDDEDKDDDEG